MTNWAKIKSTRKLYKSDNERKIKYKLGPYRKRMLRNPTRAEKRFKKILKAAIEKSNIRIGPKKIRYKFQHSFVTHLDKGYIVDFYISKLKLVFEIDGPSHNTIYAKKYDTVRSAFLASKGITEIRYSNQETMNSEILIPKVIEDLKKAKNKNKNTFLRIKYSRPKIELSREEELKLQAKYIKEYGISKFPSF